MKGTIKLKKLGLRVKKLRIAKGLSQSQLAADINKDRSSLSRLEIGAINPSYLYLQEVAVGLDISISELLKNL